MSSSIEITSAKLTYLKQITSHRQITIELFQHPETKKHIIIKTAKKNEIDIANEEARIMKTLNHPNIVQYYGHATQPTIDSRIFMEYIEYSLGQLLARDKNMSDEHHLKIAMGIASGLAYLHGQQIVHRDIKAENVLASADYSTVKLCDFGLSSDLGKASKETIAWGYGTHAWMAPEIAEYTVNVSAGAKMPAPHDPYKIDIWPLGQILLQLYINTGGMPYREIAIARLNPVLVLLVISQGKHADIPSDKPLTPIVTACLQKDPALRPTAQEIVTLLQNSQEEKKDSSNRSQLSQ